MRMKARKHNKNRYDNIIESNYDVGDLLYTKS